MRSEAAEEVRRSREEAARLVTEGQAEADRLRNQAREVLADARAEVESMRRRRDDIATELTQLSGVIEALAVSESKQRTEEQT
jgi:F0F1-type ATP synthase membrane subunit b/b'